MDASVDIAVRSVLAILAAAVPFAAVIAFLRKRLRFRPGDTSVFAALYWALFLSGCIPLIAVWALDVNGESTRPFVLTAYAACIACSWLAARTGHRAALAAVVVSIVFKWAFYQVFVWTYGFAIR